MNLGYGNVSPGGAVPYGVGSDIASFGGGLSPAAPVPVSAGAPGMTYGTPLSSGGASGFMPPTAAGAAGGVAPAGSKFGNFMGGFASLAEGLGGLGQLYIGLKSLGIAKDQLAFSKEAYQTNLTNTTKSYNTSLEDRLRSRGVTEGRDQAYTDAQIAKNQLSAGDPRTARR